MRQDVALILVAKSVATDGKHTYQTYGAFNLMNLAATLILPRAFKRFLHIKKYLIEWNCCLFIQIDSKISSFILLSLSHIFPSSHLIL
jgi:hypothetical protein